MSLPTRSSAKRHRGPGEGRIHCTIDHGVHRDRTVQPRGAGQDRGSDDAPDPERDAALIEAAANGDTLKVRDLPGRGADVTARDPAGRTALVAAAYGNHLGAAAR